MKKRVSVLLFTALFLASTVFMACSNGTSGAAENNYSANSVGQGQVMGYVLDNRGSPVEGATVTLGTKQVKTNSGGEFVIENVAVNDLVAAGLTTDTSAVSKTNFFLTATKKDKDGKDLYLPAKSAAIYVTYAEAESAASDAYITELNALVAEYSAILKAYADALKNGAASTDVTITGQTTDVVTTTTTSKTTDADGVFKVLADAIASLKDKINNREFTKDFYSDFAEFTMIPLDASFAGSVKLNLTAKTSKTTIISEKTYIPASAPVVHATYKPDSTKAPNYSWDAVVDETGHFKFEGLPSGVDVYFSIDSFYETINSAEYVFSSESSDLMIENSQAEGVFNVIAATTTTTAGTPVAVSMDTINGQKSAVFMLYAQNDKIWITDSSVKDSTGEKLLDTTAPITFKFSKPMFKVNIVASGSATKTGIKDIDEKNATVTLSSDKKTATFTPNDGNWTITSAVKFDVTGEAEDGATTILNKTFEAYFDTDIWIGLDTTAVKSFDDVDGLLALDAPIVLTFSKEMTDFVEVEVTYEKTAATANDAAVYEKVPNIYTKTWDADHKVLTIKPDTYWNIPKGNLLVAKVTKAKAADGTDSPKYWKTGIVISGSGDNAKTVGLCVYFNNYIDVIVTDTSTTSESFTIKFSKELKGFDEKTDLTISYKSGTDASGNPTWTDYNYYDYTAVLGDYDEDVSTTTTAEDGTTSTTTNKVTHKNSLLTVTAKDGIFEHEGKYRIKFANLEAVDGSTQIREKGNYKTLITSTDPYVTEFAYDGFVLKPVSIDVINTLPATAVESRAIQVVTTDKYLKIKFTKPISKATIAAGVSSAVSATNYIDSADPSIVYVSLANVNAADGGDLVVSLANKVTAVDGTSISSEPSSTDYEKWLGYDPKFRIYAALTLEGTSLIKAKETASGIITATNKDKVKINYEKADPIAPCGDITFTFSEKPDTVDWTLYAYDSTDTNGVIDAKLVDKGTVTATDKTVTIHSNKLLPNTAKAVTDNKFGALTSYYIDLSASKGGVSVFNTTNKYFPSQTAGTFEKDAIDTLIYKADTSRTTAATKLKCGTLEIKVKPIVLEKTNLIKGNNASEYEKIDSLPSKTDVTFEFDTALTGYKAIYTLYGLKKVDTDTAPTDNVILAENQEATIAGNKVTVPGEKLISKKSVGDIAKYYIELNLATAADLKDEDTVLLYSTTSTNCGVKDDSFEKAVHAGTTNIFDTAANPVAANTNLNKGAFIVEVAEPDILAETSLVKGTPFSLSDTKYEAFDGTKVEYAVPAKSEITFTLDDDVDLTGATAKYELFDLSADITSGTPPVVTTAKQLISDGNAVIDVATKTIKVQDDLMVSGNPKVTGKTFNVATSNATGISTYYLKLEVEKAGTVIFSSDTKNWWTAANEKDKDRKAFETELAKLTTNGYFKISVAPLAIDGLSFIEENTDTFDNSILAAGKKTYKAQEGIAPKSNVVITFNSQIPAGAKYYWTLKDSATATSNIDESPNKTYQTLTAASNTITIQSNKMVASTTGVNEYFIGLIVMNGEDKLFDTANAWFGAGSDFEDAVKADAFDLNNDVIKVKVLKTQVVRSEIKGVKSVTTRDDNVVQDGVDGFQKSFKSPIKLQFSYPVTGFKAVLYSTGKLYNDGFGNAHALTDITDTTNKPEVKYDKFVEESAEYIYASNFAIDATNPKIMTITPASFFDTDQTINIAVFNDEDKYLYSLVDDNSNPIVYHTLQDVDSDNTHAKYAWYDAEATKKRVKELFASSTTTALTLTNEEKIGDGNTAIFSIPTTLGTKSDALPTLKLYIKNDGEKDFAVATASTASAYDAENNVTKNDVVLSRENTILGRITNTYISTILGAKAFGIRGRTVDVLLTEENDGVFKAYKATLTDKSEPEKLAIIDPSSIDPTDPSATTWATDATYATTALTGWSGTVPTVKSTGTAGTLTLAGVTDLSTTPAGAITESKFSFKFVINGNSSTAKQIVKSVSGTLPTPKTNTAATPVSSTATVTAEFNADSDEVTLNVDGKFFKGDEIKVTVTDASGKYKDFTFTIN